MHLAPRVACWSRSALRNPTVYRSTVYRSTVYRSTVFRSTVCQPAAGAAPGGHPWA